MAKITMNKVLGLGIPLALIVVGFIAFNSVVIPMIPRFVHQIIGVIIMVAGFFGFAAASKKLL